MSSKIRAIPRREEPLTSVNSPAPKRRKSVWGMSALISPSYYLAPNGVNYIVSVQTPIRNVETVDQLMSTPITQAGGSSHITELVRSCVAGSVVVK